MKYTEIIIHMDADINPDKLVTFINEKCKQDNIHINLEVNSSIGKKTIEEQRKIFSKPIEIGEKVAIKVLTARTKHFGFEDYESDRIIVEIEPKASFGTGIHETTSMCIEAIEKHIKPDYTVLDIGCGSGILSIISLALGAKSATGVDCSNSAIKNAIYNVELNNLSDKFIGINGNLTDRIEGKFDLIVANILTDQIKELLKNIRAYMKDHSVLILSGIVDFRVNEVLEAAKEHFDIINRQDKNNWICLELKLK